MTRKSVSNLIVLVLVATSLGGCVVPVNFQDIDPATIRVTDAQTGKALVGATVTVLVDGDGDHRESVTTDSSGTARIAALSHRIWIPPLPIDFVSPHTRFSVEADGHQSEVVDGDVIYGTFNDPRCVDVRNCKRPPPRDTVALAPDGPSSR